MKIIMFVLNFDYYGCFEMQVKIWFSPLLCQVQYCAQRCELFTGLKFGVEVWGHFHESEQQFALALGNFISSIIMIQKNEALHREGIKDYFCHF